MGTWLSSWEQISQYVGPPPCLRSLNFLLSKLIHMGTPENYQLQFRFSYPGSGSSGSFCLWVFAPESCSSLCLPACLSVLGGAIPLCVLLIMDPRRLVGFSVHSAFYLLEQSDNFLVSYMWNWKPESNIYIYLQWSLVL